jgi:small subunit ribosomal protein S21
MTSEYRRPQINGNKVYVKDDNLEKAMRKFKKKVNDSGILQTLKEKEFYEKPTSIRKRAKSAAINRWNKKIANQQLPKKLF